MPIRDVCAWLSAHCPNLSPCRGAAQRNQVQAAPVHISPFSPVLARKVGMRAGLLSWGVQLEGEDSGVRLEIEVGGEEGPVGRVAQT